LWKWRTPLEERRDFDKSYNYEYENEYDGSFDVDYSDQF
jgi:hypothetical protein